MIECPYCKEISLPELGGECEHCGRVSQFGQPTDAELRRAHLRTVFNILDELNKKHFRSTYPVQYARSWRDL